MTGIAEQFHAPKTSPKNLPKQATAPNLVPSEFEWHTAKSTIWTWKLEDCAMPKPTPKELLRQVMQNQEPAGQPQTGLAPMPQPPFMPKPEPEEDLKYLFGCEMPDPQSSRGEF